MSARDLLDQAIPHTPAWYEARRRVRAGRVAFWIRTAAIVCLIVAGFVRLVQYALHVQQTTRSDQRAAVVSTTGRLNVAGRYHVTVWADSVAGGRVVLPDSSTVVLDRGSRLTYLRNVVPPIQSRPRFMILEGSGTFTMRTPWAVATPIGSAALTPGQYVVRGVAIDSGMRVTVLSGSANVFPLYGDDPDRVQLDSGFTIWLPMLGPVPPARRADQR